MTMNDTTFSIVVPREIAKQARIVAAKLDTTRSALMRKLIVDFLADYERNGNRARGENNHDIRR